MKTLVAVCLAAAILAAPVRALTNENKTPAPTAMVQGAKTTMNPRKQALVEDVFGLVNGVFHSEDQYKQATACMLAVPGDTNSGLKGSFDALRWENMKANMIAVYDEVYTEDDLEAMVAFYKSSTGKMFLERMSQVMSNMSAIVMERSFENGIADMKTRGYSVQVERNGNARTVRVAKDDAVVPATRGLTNGNTTTPAAAPLPEAGASADPKARALAERLLGLMNAEAQAKSALQLVLRIIAPMSTMPDMPADIKENMVGGVDALAKALRWESLRPDLIAVMAQVYSAGELEDLIAFYESPTGRMFADKDPQAMARIYGMLGEVMDAVGKQMADLLRQATAEGMIGTEEMKPPAAGTKPRAQ